MFLILDFLKNIIHYQAVVNIVMAIMYYIK